MTAPLFEVLDEQATPMGVISLRRRLELRLQVDVYEVKLGDEYLMSSLFTVAEEELARLGLAALDPTDEAVGLDVVVGGLGLGWTAITALADPRVRSLRVVEALDTVVDWHKRQLLPDAASLVTDPRCSFVVADFFAEARGSFSLGEGAPDRYHAILLDVDHSPSRWLHPSHADLYTADGLAGLCERLHPGGVFALWSDDPPDPAFEALLAEVFATTRSHVVAFPNPFTDDESTNSVYVATA